MHSRGDIILYTQATSNQFLVMILTAWKPLIFSNIKFPDRTGEVSPVKVDPAEVCSSGVNCQLTHLAKDGGFCGGELPKIYFSFHYCYVLRYQNESFMKW